MSAPQQQQRLTSTTAPGKVFSSRSELAEHYKSDWHKYNLKRREAGMVMLGYDDFSARLEAARALRAEREQREERSGRDHLKDKKGVATKKKKGEKTLSKRQLRKLEKSGGGGSVEKEPEKEEEEDDEEDSAMDADEGEGTQQQEEEETPVIDPNQSLFDSHISPSVEENVEYMYKKYGFFIPDTEYLSDLEGLVGYCAEKVKLGHYCLYCQKMFKTYRGCQEHMITTRHCKLRYEAGVDMEEFDVFYDFTAANEEFISNAPRRMRRHKKAGEEPALTEDQEMQDEMEDDDDDDDDDSGEWEDIDSDEEMDDDDDDDDEAGIYAAYEDEIKTHGYDITPLGELIFPNGRIIGHRGLAKYYKQRFAPDRNARTAVVAARRANGERLFEGRVYDVGAGQQEDSTGGASIMTLAKAGLVAGAAQGRQGRGILVPTGNGGAAGRQGFTALSLYRYKAAVKKANKEEFKGRRLQQRTTLPMNKMDKKANRLYNNVSVAHAKR